MSDIVRSFNVREGVRLRYVPTAPDGSVVRTGDPVFTFDPPLDGSILAAVRGGDPLGTDAFEAVLKSADGLTTGHFETTCTASANASTAGEPDREVFAVAHLSVTLTPEEASAALLQDDGVFELAAGDVGGGVVAPVVTGPDQVVGLPPAGLAVEAPASVGGGQVQVPSAGGALATDGPVTTPAGSVAPDSGNPGSASVTTTTSPEPGVSFSGTPPTP